MKNHNDKMRSALAFIPGPAENHNEISNLKAALMHEQDITKACETASGWTPGDTPLPVYIDRMHLENIAFGYAISALRVHCGLEPGECFSDVADAFDRVRKERDEAQAKCAEMLKCIQAHHAHHLDGVRVFFSQDGKPIDMETDLTEAYVESRLCDQTLHALSTDCGKGFVSVDELDATIKLLKDYIQYCQEWRHKLAERFPAELARLEALRKGAK